MSPLKSAEEIAGVLAEVSGVRKIKVEMGPAGIEVVKVLVPPERDTPETVRQLQTTASQALDLKLDASQIELLSTAVAPSGPSRRRLTMLTLTREPERFVARVALESEGDTLIGESESPLGRRDERWCVAQATLKALEPLTDDAPRLQAVEALRVAGATLMVVYLTRKGSPLAGSAPVRFDEYDAVARATLDALNRVIALVG